MNGFSALETRRPGEELLCEHWCDPCTSASIRTEWRRAPAKYRAGAAQDAFLYGAQLAEITLLP